MPFIKRSIEPVKIRQGALDKTDISLGEEHEVIVNSSCSKILLQLSQLATFANEIFTDLSQECKGVLEKTHRLKARVWSLDQIAQDLNVLETPLRKYCSNKGLDQCHTGTYPSPVIPPSSKLVCNMPQCCQFTLHRTVAWSQI